MSRPLGLVALACVTFALGVLACGKDKGTGPAPTPELDSPALLGATAGSQNYVHAFANAGTYEYHCTFHTSGTHREGGTVTVDPQGPDSAFVSISLGAFHPATATVKPGGPVRWQNFDDGVHHTVTSE